MRVLEGISIVPGVIRGLSTGDPIGPANTMSYKVAVNFPDGMRQLEGMKPAMHRWPPEIKARAIEAGTIVPIALTKGIVQLMARELPHFEPCPGGDSLLSNPGDLLRTVQAMTREQRRLLRSLLEL